MNTWPDGKRRSLTQDQHESWNARNYPGTRQLCTECDEPTGRCEEDAMWSEEGEPLCEECYANNALPKTAIDPKGMTDEQ